MCVQCTASDETRSENNKKQKQLEGMLDDQHVRVNPPSLCLCRSTMVQALSDAATWLASTCVLFFRDRKSAEMFRTAFSGVKFTRSCSSETCMQHETSCYRILSELSRQHNKLFPVSLSLDGGAGSSMAFSVTPPLPASSAMHHHVLLAILFLRFWLMVVPC